MTDRELLELAAKAAGIDGAMRPDGIKTGVSKYWNPLADDGDALRLAMKLGINIKSSHTDVFAYTLTTEAIVCAKPDRNAATRRAIVRAAAEIGRMKS